MVMLILATSGHRRRPGFGRRSIGRGGVKPCGGGPEGATDIESSSATLIMAEETARSSAQTQCPLAGWRWWM